MLTTLILIGLGLAMDAFSVSISNGLCMSRIRFKTAFMIAFSFGFAQAAMPLIGYFAGTFFSGYIEAIDHWIALVLLGVIGIKMIIEAVQEIKNPSGECKWISMKLIFVQSIATSIDALAIGISFAALKVNIAMAAGIIGVITFGLCLPAVYIGKKVGGIFKEKAEILGGLILVFIGLKIFIEHIIG